MKLKEKQKLADEFKTNNGAVSFDFKNRTLLFNDGGLFSIEKEIKLIPRTRFVNIKTGKDKGNLKLKTIKGPKVKYEYYDATLWFEELHETINYLKRLEKCLKKMGYNVDGKYKNNNPGKSGKC